MDAIWMVEKLVGKKANIQYRPRFLAASGVAVAGAVAASSASPGRDCQRGHRGSGAFLAGVGRGMNSPQHLRPPAPPLPCTFAGEHRAAGDGDAGDEAAALPGTVVGSDPQRIVSETLAVLNGKDKAGRVPELWDGRVAERIVRVIASHRVS